MRKTTRCAMQHLIDEVRKNIPFDIPESTICSGPCQGCSKKLLEFLDDQLCDWQAKLDRGQVPNLGEINQLSRISKRIYNVLKRNGFIKT